MLTCSFNLLVGRGRGSCHNRWNSKSGKLCSMEIQQLAVMLIIIKVCENKFLNNYRRMVVKLALPSWTRTCQVHWPSCGKYKTSSPVVDTFHSVQVRRRLALSTFWPLTYNLGSDYTRVSVFLSAHQTCGAALVVLWRWWSLATIVLSACIFHLRSTFHKIRVAVWRQEIRLRHRGCPHHQMLFLCAVLIEAVVVLWEYLCL